MRMVGLSLAVVAALAAGVVVFFFAARTQPNTASSPIVQPMSGPPPASSAAPSSPEAVPGSVAVPAAEAPPLAPAIAAATNLPSAANTPKPPRPKPPLQDPVAREALGLVGADPEAEAYWFEAICDTSLPANEREDLMEDLNEDGLSDPKRPGPQDLPLILNRLAIIEQIVPNADDFMLRHLGEAYKDLVNLAAITQGGGQPVR